VDQAQVPYQKDIIFHISFVIQQPTTAHKDIKPAEVLLMMP